LEKIDGVDYNTQWATRFVPNVFHAYDSIGGQVVNNTEATIPIDSVVVSDSKYSFVGSELEFLEAGLYKVTLECLWQITNTGGGTRGSVRASLEEDPGTGFQDISYAASGNYHREGGRNSSASLTVIRQFPVGTKIRGRVQRTNGTTNINLSGGGVDGGSRLTVEFIR
jgi:hypothetical protein